MFRKRASQQHTDRVFCLGLTLVNEFVIHNRELLALHASLSKGSSLISVLHWLINTASFTRLATLSRAAAATLGLTPSV